MLLGGLSWLRFCVQGVSEADGEGVGGEHEGVAKAGEAEVAVSHCPLGSNKRVEPGWGGDCCPLTMFWQEVGEEEGLRAQAGH